MADGHGSTTKPQNAREDNTENIIVEVEVTPRRSVLSRHGKRAQQIILERTTRTTLWLRWR